MSAAGTAAQFTATNGAVATPATGRRQHRREHAGHLRPLSLAEPDVLVKELAGDDCKRGPIDADDRDKSPNSRAL